MAVNNVPKATNPYSLDQPCYADSRNFLENKDNLKHAAQQLQQLKLSAEDSHNAFTNALDPLCISDQQVLGIKPLLHLPEIEAIACEECGCTLPATEKGLTRHLKDEHSDVYYSLMETKGTVPAKVRNVLSTYPSGLCETGAWHIPHGMHFFPALTLYLDGIACGFDGCGWIGIMHAPSKARSSELKGARKHVEEVHGKVFASDESVRESVIFPLPVQRVERLQSAAKVWFVTCLPEGCDKESSEKQVKQVKHEAKDDKAARHAARKAKKKERKKARMASLREERKSEGWTVSCR